MIYFEIGANALPKEALFIFGNGVYDSAPNYEICPYYLHITTYIVRCMYICKGIPMYI